MNTRPSSHSIRAGRSAGRAGRANGRRRTHLLLSAIALMLSAGPGTTALAQQGTSDRTCDSPGVLDANAPCAAESAAELGREVAVPRYLEDGDEFALPLPGLIAQGRQLFGANWTAQEGAGRPFLTGTGGALPDPDKPLGFPRNFNRVSAPDSNSCAGCHNLPRMGGGGDFVTNVFVTAQRFQFASFDIFDELPGSGSLNELGLPVSLQDIGNSRSTIGMFGSGYIEMLARQMTTELRSIRDEIEPGDSAALVTKGISFGTLARVADGSWDVTGTEGFVTPSIASTGANDPPSLIIRPFHHASAVISLREFSNNALNHHHGIQSVERFGEIDADGDGFDQNLSVADITAIAAFQAQLAVPGRVIPRNRHIEAAVANGEELFMDIGCGGCHVPTLPLTDEGWVYVEPNPFNTPGNLRPGEAPEFEFDLNNPRLDPPRLHVDAATNSVWVPAFTDLKVHDITSGPDDPNCEPIKMQATTPEEFLAGNCEFLTKKLWGTANEKPARFHHGQFTTMREAIESHRGEAMDAYVEWTLLDDYGRDSIIEFLKTLQILPEGTRWQVVDENHRPRNWQSAFDR